jgi:CheY-like chemotaxis protein
MKISDGRAAMILIVEDIDWLRSSMKRSVERCGYRPVAAEDDAEALALAEQESPALILTEEKLPTFNTLMTRLREHPTLNALPVVIINPDAEEGERYNGCILLTDYDQISKVLIALTSPTNS